MSRFTLKRTDAAPGRAGAYSYGPARIWISGPIGGTWYATVRFRNQEKDLDARSLDAALDKATRWIDDAPELARRDVLTTRKRENLRSSEFALPERRALPIHDASHARNAAARLEQMRRRRSITEAEYRRAHAAIRRAERRFGIQPRERDEDDDWHVLDKRTGCVCPVGSRRAAENRAYQANRSAGEERLVAQRRGCTTGPAPEDRPIVFEAHDANRERRASRGRDYVLSYGRSAVSQPHALLGSAVKEAKALSLPQSFGGEVAVIERRGHHTREVGRARRGTFFESQRDPRTRNADLIAWYRKNGDLSMGRGFREEKVEWLRHSNREPALAAMRRLGYRG